MNEFAVGLNRDFVDRTLERLREAFPEHYHGRARAELEAFIGESIRQATAFGLETETTVGRYLDYRLWFGPKFETSIARDWMLGVLGDGSLSDSEKIYRIDMELFAYSLEDGPDGE